MKIGSCNGENGHLKAHQWLINIQHQRNGERQKAI